MGVNLLQMQQLPFGTMMYKPDAYVGGMGDKLARMETIAEDWD
jgi:hypothetical protein